MKLTEDQENIRVECKIQDNFPAETIIILQDEHMQTSKHDVFLLHDTLIKHVTTLVQYLFYLDLKGAVYASVLLQTNTA